MRKLTLLALSFVGLGASGCYLPGRACTDLLVYSVEVTVFDAEGQPYVPDEVTYTVDGSPERPCEQGLPEEEYGHQFACGGDEDGDFVIRVIDEGEVLAEEALHLHRTPDRCHVVPQAIEIVL